MTAAPAFTLPAPAKLNLFLHILGRRADGYHELQTLFQFLDWGDDLGFAGRDDGELQLHDGLPGVAPAQNLILRAARLLQQESATTKGADLWLTKRLPMGGGPPKCTRTRSAGTPNRPAMIPPIRVPRSSNGSGFSGSRASSSSPVASRPERRAAATCGAE